MSWLSDLFVTESLVIRRFFFNKIHLAFATYHIGEQWRDMSICTLSHGGSSQRQAPDRWVLYELNASKCEYDWEMSHGPQTKQLHREEDTQNTYL